MTLHNSGADGGASHPPFTCSFVHDTIAHVDDCTLGNAESPMARHLNSYSLCSTLIFLLFKLKNPQEMRIKFTQDMHIIAEHLPAHVCIM